MLITTRYVHSLCDIINIFSGNTTMSGYGICNTNKKLIFAHYRTRNSAQPSTTRKANEITDSPVIEFDQPFQQKITLTKK